MRFRRPTAPGAPPGGTWSSTLWPAGEVPQRLPPVPRSHPSGVCSGHPLWRWPLYAAGCALGQPASARALATAPLAALDRPRSPCWALPAHISASASALRARSVDLVRCGHDLLPGELRHGVVDIRPGTTRLLEGLAPPLHLVGRAPGVVAGGRHRRRVGVSLGRGVITKARRCRIPPSVATAAVRAALARARAGAERAPGHPRPPSVGRALAADAAAPAAARPVPPLVARPWDPKGPESALTALSAAWARATSACARSASAIAGARPSARRRATCSSAMASATCTFASSRACRRLRRRFLLVGARGSSRRAAAARGSGREAPAGSPRR